MADARDDDFEPPILPAAFPIIAAPIAQKRKGAEARFSQGQN